MNLHHRLRLLHYILLALLFTLGAAFFIRFQYFPKFQFATVVATVAAYIIWGLSHHASERRLSWGVIAEYLLLGFVVILMFATVLNIHI